MAAGEGVSPVALEYFASEGDALFGARDAELVALAKDDLRRLGVARGVRVLDAFVMRAPKAYPVYAGDYRARVAALRRCAGALGNLVSAGRAGQFRYNNMDHSIMTGFLAARKLAGQDVDPWAVNEEAEYLEESGRP